MSHVVLDVSPQTLPAVLRPAEGTEILEIVPLSGDFLEIFPIVDLRLVAAAVDEPDLASSAAVFSTLGEQVLNEAEYRCDSGSGGNEDAVGERLAECEETVGTVELKRLADFQITKQIRKIAALYAIYA